jgi:LmbE family N-acetylglucosaminyl deacetylase
MARTLAAAIVEQIWWLGFALVGRIAQPDARRWSSPGGQRVLVIAPHPDDEAIGCGGTLLLHRAAGDTVCIAWVTDGRSSRALGLEPEEMARRREQEARACARLLGACVEWLGLREGEWSIEQLRRELSTMLDRLAPQVIYAPSRVDFHPEHERVAHGLALALAGLPPSAAPQVRVYQVQVPLTAILTNMMADTSGVAGALAAALRVYVTQAGNLGRALRQRRYSAAFYGPGRQAEEFWQLPADRYIAMHSDSRSWSAHAVRGVRRFPWSDPLAYLWGRAERRRLARSGAV